MVESGCGTQQTTRHIGLVSATREQTGLDMLAVSTSAYDPERPSGIPEDVLYMLQRTTIVR
jgi:hypothetical protein